jgi:hypothetical protein
LAQPFLSLSLPDTLAFQGIAQGDPGTGALVLKAFSGGSPPREPVTVAALQAELKIRENKPAEAYPELKRIYAQPGFDRDPLDIAVLSLCARRQTDAGLAPAWTFIKDLPDPAVREDALRLLAASAVVSGQGPALWKMVSPVDVRRRLTPTDLASLARGFLAGMAVRPSEAAPSPQGAP